MKKGFTHESAHNESIEWYTPREIFTGLNLEFDLDPCSPGADTVPWVPALRHLTRAEDGLNAHWEGRVWMNPPYGTDTQKWFRHLALAGNGIGLVFARTDTRWFHEFAPSADAICFIKGRIQFVPAKRNGIDYHDLYNKGTYQPKGGCGAASMLIAFGTDNAKALFRCNLGMTLPIKAIPLKAKSQAAKAMAVVRKLKPGLFG